MTLYAYLFVPNKIKIWNVMSIVLPLKVPTSEKLTEHNVQNEDSLPSELGRKN
jgi:hypothetical protein